MRVDTEARGECGGGVEPRQSAPCVATPPEVSAPSAKSPPSYPQDASRVPRSLCGAEVGRCGISRLLSAGVPLLPSHLLIGTEVAEICTLRFWRQCRRGKHKQQLRLLRKSRQPKSLQIKFERYDRVQKEVSPTSADTKIRPSCEPTAPTLRT